MTIPLWKLNRELRRIGNQILRSPYIILDIHERLMEPVWRHRHRKAFDAHAAVGDGQVAETQRVAIFLIYQPGGVAQSTISLCENMIALGFSPFIVSNAPLSQTDRSRIDAVAWKVMERPNFGYDFGGYQDALFALRDLKDTLEYLIIMNDSVWLEFTPDLWERLLAQDSDVVGFIQEDKLASRNGTIKKSEDRNLQSYFFLFQEKIWNSEIFWSFWKNYKMTNNKKRTIKRGEIGFTLHLLQNGITTSGLITRFKFLEKITGLENDVIDMILRYSIYKSSRLENMNGRLLRVFDNSSEWRERATSHIRNSLDQEPLNGSFWVGACLIFNINLIKKNKQALYGQMRQQYLSAYEADDTYPLPSDIAAELAAAVEQETNRAVT